MNKLLLIIILLVSCVKKGNKTLLVSGDDAGDLILRSTGPATKGKVFFENWRDTIKPRIRIPKGQYPVSRDTGMMQWDGSHYYFITPLNLRYHLVDTSKRS